MKSLIASDLHGSAFFVNKLMDVYEKENPNKLLLLGDILYHGPRNNLPEGYCPKDVLSLLNQIKDKILCVRGNCDTEVDQMVLDFPIMADYAFLEVNGVTIFATHGHKFNTTTPPPLTEGTILLHGHTHIPVCEKHDNYWYMNPGSISIPKNNSPHSYILLDEDGFHWKTLDLEQFMDFQIH